MDHPDDNDNDNDDDGGVVGTPCPSTTTTTTRKTTSTTTTTRRRTTNSTNTSTRSVMHRYRAVAAGDVRVAPRSDATSVRRLHVGQEVGVVEGSAVDDEGGRRWFRLEDGNYTAVTKKDGTPKLVSLDASTTTTTTTSTVMNGSHNHNNNTNDNDINHNSNNNNQQLDEFGRRVRPHRCATSVNTTIPTPSLPLPNPSSTSPFHVPAREEGGGGGAGVGVGGVVRLWLVRHGERVDETADQSLAFFRSCPPDRHWDPPLTLTGMDQARDAGLRLRSLSSSETTPKKILSSPCLRTVQTAAEMAAVLSCPVQLVPGLAECAAAVRRRGLALTRFCSRDELARRCRASVAWYPPSPTSENGHGHEGEYFASCLLRIVREAIPGTTVIAVTHREGIRELYDRLEEDSYAPPTTTTTTHHTTPTKRRRYRPRRYIEYCHIAKVCYDLTTRQWSHDNDHG